MPLNSCRGLPQDLPRRFRVQPPCNPPSSRIQVWLQSTLAQVWRMSLLVGGRRFEMSTNVLKEGQDMQKNSMRTNIDPFLKRTNNSPESDPRAVAQRWMDQFHRSLTSTSPASAAE